MPHAGAGRQSPLALGWYFFDHGAMLIPARRPPVRELIEPPPGASLVVRDFHPSHWRFNWHHHPELELTIILAGSGVRYVGDSVEPFGPGDCVLLGADLPHTWTSRALPVRPHHSLVLQFPAELGIGGTPEVAGLRRLAQRAARGLAFRGALAREVIAGVRAIAGCVDPLDRLGRTLSLLARLAAAEGRSARPLATAALAARPRDARLAAVLAQIHQRAASGLGQGHAAASAGLSPAAFSRFFRRATGKSFVAHLNEVRVGLACRALAEGDQPVTAVAFDAGFQNLANFNRRFRTVTGMTPSRYRELARGTAG
jgi:AraC-like DNA-binding protein